MPVASANALFQAVWVISISKHLHIVIAFQHQRVATVQDRFDMRRGAARIGQHTQSAHTIAEYVLNRFGSIVRHGISLHLHFADRESKMRTDLGGRQRRKRRVLRAQGAVGEPDGEVEFARQSGDAGNVIAMLVRDHDAVQLPGLQTQPRQTRYRFTQREAAVEQDSRLANLHNEGITLAAATENGEPHLRGETSILRHEYSCPDSGKSLR